jgi:hypothetical protein
MGKRMAATLAPGDRYLDGGHDDIVEIIGGQEECPNQFGLPWFKYLAKRESDGKVGYVVFGQTGTVDGIED